MTTDWQWYVFIIKNAPFEADSFWKGGGEMTSWQMVKGYMGQKRWRITALDQSVIL